MFSKISLLTKELSEHTWSKKENGLGICGVCDETEDEDKCEKNPLIDMLVSKLENSTFVL